MYHFRSLPFISSDFCMNFKLRYAVHIPQVSMERSIFDRGLSLKSLLTRASHQK
jgi:hypothetical protein